MILNTMCAWQEEKCESKYDTKCETEYATEYEEVRNNFFETEYATEYEEVGNKFLARSLILPFMF